VKRRSDFSRKRALAYVIGTTPGLGSFAAAVGVLGFEGALELCETRDPSPRVRQLWDALGYALASLPTRDEVDLVITGAEIARRLAMHRTNEGPVPVASVIDGVCASAHEAKRALDMLKSYGGRVEPLCEEVSAL
jgi:hypothetical protein